VTITVTEGPYQSESSAPVRQTFIAGIFAAVPLAVTIFIVWWIDDKMNTVSRYLFHRSIPFHLGVLVAIGIIYVTGLITRSLLGKFLIKLVDTILMRLPVVRQLYLGWKQIALTPGGSEGTFSRVVLIPDEFGSMKLLGFTSGRIVEADEPCYCVFVPSSPNPITGRLYFVPLEKCQVIAMTAEEAFKVVLSTGNYVPPLVAAGKPDSQPPLPAPAAALPLSAAPRS
jgi:uncharacterized membrane protein